MGWFEQFFGKAGMKELDPDYSASLERIEESLASLPEKEARFLACTALLAARVAHVDSEVTEGEKKRIFEVLRDRLGLSAEKAKAVTEIALDSELSHSIEHHLVTRKLNELASREQKIEILRALFHVAAEDDVSEQESDKIGGIASALLLPRSDYLAVRAEYREHRALLKGLPK